MKTSVTYRQIWNIAYPIILGSIAQNIINVTDTAFLGRVGEVALGAAAVGGLFYFAVFILGFGYGLGTQIIVARRNGEEKFQDIGKTIEHALYFLVPASFVVFAILEYFSTPFLGWIIKSEQIFLETDKFINIRAYGIFFSFTNMVFRAFYVGVARTKVITYTTIVLATVNIFLDYCLIFGRFGFPEMGIEGAALASVIAEVSATSFFIIYTFSTVPLKKYRLFYFTGFSIELFFRTFRISFPIMMQNFISMAAWFAFFLVVEKMGERPLAISNIVRSFYIVLLIPIWGFSTATNTLVSNIIGQKKPGEVIPVVLKVMLLCLSGVFIIVALSISFPHKILRIYTDNMELINETMPVLYVISGAAMMLAVSFISFNGVSGTGKTQVSFMIEFIVIVIYLVVTYLLAVVFRYDIHVVWSSEYIYACILGFLSFMYLRSGKWQKGRV